MEQKENTTLATLVLRMVSKNNGRWSLHEKASECFSAGLDALFLRTDLNHKAELESVLSLCFMFEKKQMFELVDRVLCLIASEDRALHTLGIEPGNNAQLKKRKFAELTGQRRGLLAPAFGQSAPTGSLKASSFLDPGREIPRKPVSPVAPARRRF
jgi:hypothetical protein